MGIPAFPMMTIVETYLPAMELSAYRWQEPDTGSWHGTGEAVCEWESKRYNKLFMRPKVEMSQTVAEETVVVKIASEN